MTGKLLTGRNQNAAQWIDAAARRMRRAHLFYGHGAASAEDEAHWMLAHASRLSPIRLAEYLEQPLTTTTISRAEALLSDRIRTRAPAAYLIKEAWLDGRRFYVDERVIIPRSFIAEVLRDSLLPYLHSGKISKVLDMCTGSGCLAILAGLQFRKATIDAVDVSPHALLVAAINVRRHRLGRRLKLYQSDLFGNLPPNRYQLILSNPPYVDARSMRTLPIEYRREPAIALAGGKDGLKLIRRIITEAPNYLEPQGILVVEIGHNRNLLEQIYPRLPFTWLETASGDEFVFMLTREQLVKEGATKQRRPG